MFVERNGLFCSVGNVEIGIIRREKFDAPEGKWGLLRWEKVRIEYQKNIPQGYPKNS